MKDLRFETTHSHFNLNHRPYFTPTKNKKRKAKNEFEVMLEAYTTEAADELEEYRVSFPRTNLFWDNGIEDLERH